MKTHTKIKTVNGHDYAYEITYYYDKATKRSRQRSRYLGKVVNGEIVRVREGGKLPLHALSYGEFLPLVAIAEALALPKALVAHLPDDKAQAALALAVGRVARPLACANVASWVEGTVLPELYPQAHFSSQYLSKLLAELGKSDVPYRVAGEIARAAGPDAKLVYDITSLSSRAKGISYLEWGYSRDGADLPQVNLSLVVDKGLGIPVAYDIAPGSVVDVTTLRETLSRLEGMGVSGYSLVMDRGFFSTGNIEALLDAGVSFLIPATGALKCVKEAYSALRKTIEVPEHSRIHGGELLFAADVALDVGGRAVPGHGYFSPKRREDEVASFYRGLHEAVARLEAAHVRSWHDWRELARHLARGYHKYLGCRVTEGRFEVSYKRNAISARLNRCGLLILLHNDGASWQEALTAYRERDIVEKGFRSLKSELGALPLNAKREDTLRGGIFIAFLALAIRMRLRRLMNERGLSEKYTMAQLLIELEKVRAVRQASGRLALSHVTKRQREILEALDVDVHLIECMMEGEKKED